MSEQDDGAASLVRSDALLALWVTAFEAFQSASAATRIGDIPGGGFDRAARMWGDFEQIVGHLKANAPADRAAVAGKVRRDVGADDWKRDVWLRAHDIAAVDLPRILSGMCQQPGLAAMLANYAIKVTERRTAALIDSLGPNKEVDRDE